MIRALTLENIQTMAKDRESVTLGELREMAAATLPPVSRARMWNVLTTRFRNGEKIDGAVNIALVAGALRTNPVDALGLIEAVVKVWGAK